MNPTLMAYFQDYADSHRHPTNRLTHKIAIPVIVFHVVAMLDWIHLGAIGLPALSMGHILAIGSLIWYARLSVPLALMMAVVVAPMFPLAALTPRWLVVVLAVVGWTVQLAGHSIWEKNRPAFLKNMFQALIGPLFFVALYTGFWPPKAAPSAQPRA